MIDLPPDIAAILAFNETGAQFFKRVQQERVLTGFPIIDNNLSLRHGVVLEVVGPSGSGKTELLLSIALHVLLSPYADPKAWLAAPNHQPKEQSQPPQRSGPQHLHPAEGTPREGSVRHHQQGPQPSSTTVTASGGSVVIFDLDGKFDGIRLMQVLEPQVHSAWRDQQLQLRIAARNCSGGAAAAAATAATGHPISDAVVTATATATAIEVTDAEPQMLSPDQVVEAVLSRLHLVRCHSSLQLLTALAALPKRLEALQAEGSPCRLLLIDNVGAHYWRDRAAKDLPPGTRPTTSKGGGGNYPSPYHHEPPHHHHQQQQPHQPPHQPLALSLFEMHAAIAARLSYVSRRHRLPVVATKTAAVSATGLPEGGGGGGGGLEAAAGGVMEGEVQLQQREFMPITWQNAVTHRLLLYPRGAVVPGGATLPPSPRGKQPHLQPQPQPLTAILAEMLGADADPAAAAAASGAPASVAGTAAATGNRVGNNVFLKLSAAATAGGGRPRGRLRVTQLLVSSVAMVEQW
ncbi:hypothetical protein VaNZ11_005883 [Volvox africanus]|uniref:RecA family profile 1 domain-containing protein n=1 Tax=Volvox africanus TaxID=51714 RepID=A0ABQ5S0J9_9CHLO|nr:hypothetical protein VaNZ11_005883 [Volvox africanus]